MTNLVTFKGANLPAVSTLVTTLRSLNVDAGGVGTVIIKMDKTGHWVFGADQTEVEDDSTWAINPYSFLHGFVAWGEGEVLGEAMAPLSEPRPEVGVAPADAKKGWESQVGLSMKCLSGEDKGLEGRYTTTSKGGKGAVQELAVAIAAQVEKDQTKPVPVVRLKSGSYKHKNYGKVITPLFEIVEWISLDGKADEPAAEAEAEVPAEAAPAGRRRRG
jgi:hypothetical protein